MPTIPVNLATEDELSEAVIRRLLAEVDRGYTVGRAFGRNGYGYLRSTIKGWNRAAQGVPFVIITDLDQYPCAPALIEDWLNTTPHPNLMFRVAVREIEAWLLADRENLAKFLSVSLDLFPQNVEDLVDPKKVLVDIARRSRIRSIRERVSPRLGSTARQGPDYNGCLIEFVSKDWNITVASAAARSLFRAVQRVRTFEPLWPAK